MKIKFKNFCGIFATLFVTTTMVLLASCSQDDDNYDSDMYTLAEMGTRLGGGDPGNGGYDPNPPIPYFGNPVKAGADTINFELAADCPMEAYINWSRGYTGMTAPVSGISVLISFYPILWENNDTCRAVYYITSSTAEWFGFNNDMKIKIKYSKDSIVNIDNRDTTYIFNREHEETHHADCIPDPTLHPL
ncbi:MAG: hypothetical protein K6A93_09255 [Bacteroidaceae bacterium]|nr:hypothetical protein [Bacteroidaceae bacterium]